MSVVGMVGLCMVSSCAQNKEPLHVSVFKLSMEKTNAPMVRGEQQKRFYGAVTKKDRQERVGQYYTVAWALPEAPKEPTSIEFHYRLAATASKEYLYVMKLPEGQRRGKVEFKHIGSEYEKSGNVIAWKMDLKVGNTLYATRESYMWE